MVATRAASLSNHSANLRHRRTEATSLIRTGNIGQIRHVTAFVASPVNFIFNNPANKGSDHMLGNGFRWGQLCHLLGWVFHVAGERVRRLFCWMNHSNATGINVLHSATVVCQDRVNISGTEGAVVYVGDDMDSLWGRLEHQILLSGERDESTTDLPCPDLGFYFENTDDKGTGPESVQNFIHACLGLDHYERAGTLIGLRTVQTVDAMCRSILSENVEDVT